MQACRNQNEILMLDALEELNDPRMRRDWEEHLKTCDGCRLERARMRNLLGKVKRAGMPPELSVEQADAMAKAVGWRLRNERMASSRETGRDFRFRFVPALATACAIIVVAMVAYQLRDDRGGTGNEMVTATDVMPQQDLDVIQHLDLLKDMDTIEKLVHVVDVPENGSGTEEGAPETQGRHRDETGKSYA